MHLRPLCPFLSLAQGLQLCFCGMDCLSNDAETFQTCCMTHCIFGKQERQNPMEVFPFASGFPILYEQFQLCGERCLEHTTLCYKYHITFWGVHLRRLAEKNQFDVPHPFHLSGLFHLGVQNLSNYHCFHWHYRHVTVKPTLIIVPYL